MAWVVDSCVLLDIALADPQFGLVSAQCVARYAIDGIVACPVSQIEIAPQFGGHVVQVKHFLLQTGIHHNLDWIDDDTEAASRGWTAYVKARRHGQTNRRPIADIQIGGFAMRFQGLITRNPSDFEPWFPALAIIVP